MNLKERILNNINYSTIAEKVFEILEDDIKDEVLNSIDENDIARAIVDDYRDSLIETAKDRVLEDIVDSIGYDEIESEFKDVVDEETCWRGQKMNINLESSNDQTKLNNGDIVIIKDKCSSDIERLLYFLEDCSDICYPTLVNLDEWWCESIYYRIPDEYQDIPYEEAVKYYIEVILECTIEEIIPSDEIEIRRI